MASEERTLTVQDKAKSLRVALESADVQAIIKKALPDSPENSVRMAQIALTATTKNPLLLDCDRASIITTLITCSQLGLSLDSTLGQAYPVPYWNGQKKRFDCQLQVGYQGYIQLFYNTGLVSKVHAAVVFEGDQFRFDEANDDIMHIPCRPSERKKDGEGQPIRVAAYARVWMKDGAVKSRWVWDEEVLSRKGRSASVRNQEKARADKKSYIPDTPWDTDTDAMWKKTAVRALASLMPKSTTDNSLHKATDIETRHEMGKLVRPEAPDGGVITIDANDYNELEADAGNPPAPESLADKVKPKDPKPAAKGKEAPKKEVPVEEDDGRPFTKPELRGLPTLASQLEEVLVTATGGDESQMTAFLKFLTKQKVGLEDLRAGKLSDDVIKEAILLGQKEIGG